MSRLLYKAGLGRPESWEKEEKLDQHNSRKAAYPAFRLWLVRYEQLYLNRAPRCYGKIANQAKDSRIFANPLRRQVKMGVSSSV